MFPVYTKLLTGIVLVNKELLTGTVFLWIRNYCVETGNIRYIPTNYFFLFLQMGHRELEWYNMAKYDALGKKHWHPEFRELDYHVPAYQPAKFRPEGKKKGMGYSRVKKVFPPIPDPDN